MIKYNYSSLIKGIGRNGMFEKINLIKELIEKNNYIEAFHLLNNIKTIGVLSRRDKIYFICFQCVLLLKENKLLNNKILKNLGINDIHIIDMLNEKQIENLLKKIISNEKFHPREKEYQIRKKIIFKIKNKKKFIKDCLLKNILEIMDKEDIKTFLNTENIFNYSKKNIQKYFFNLAKEIVKNFKLEIQKK